MFLQDDYMYHYINRITVSACDFVFTACPLSDLKFKELGYTSEAIANYMALLGWSPPEGMEERFNIKEASKVFTFERINKSGAKFDWDKLNWLNSQVINEWSSETLFNSITLKESMCW